MLRQVACGQEQGHEIGGVVAHAGRIHPAVLLMQRQLAGVGKDHVGVGSKDHEVAMAVVIERADDVGRIVHYGAVHAVLPHPVADEGRPALLVM